MRKSKRGLVEGLLFLALMCFLTMFASDVQAYSVDFHGYLESNIILRDTNGFQHGVMDQVEAIQQRNTLKFDVDVDLQVPLVCDIMLDKAHLTYRGAYDTIFNLRGSEYDAIPNKRGKSRFDLGLDDIKTENDLREASFDITYRGDLGSAFIRPGRQLVSWGEATIQNLVDVVNPLDASIGLSAFPDEMKTPLWMCRLVYSIPPQENLNMNFDFVVVPDLRPTRLAPLDSSSEVPYMTSPYLTNSKLAQIARGPLGKMVFGNPDFKEVYEEVPSGRAEYGGRMTVDIGENLSVSGVYYRGIADNPAAELHELAPLLPLRADFVHPWMKTYGLYFNSYISPPLDVVLKGEFAYNEDIPISRIFDMSTVRFENGVGYVYDIGDQYSTMLGFNKNFWAKWLSPSQVNSGFEWIHTHTDDYIHPYDVREDTDIFDFMALWYWWNGRISPMIFVGYETSNAWMGNLNVPWVIDKNWKLVMDALSFFGHDREANKGAWGDDGHNASAFAPMIDTTSQIMFKLIYQW